MGNQKDPGNQTWQTERSAMAMIHAHFGKKSLVLAVAIVAVSMSVSAASAQDYKHDLLATAFWDAPADSAAVVEYVVQLSTNNGPWVEVGRTTETKLPLYIMVIENEGTPEERTIYSYLVEYYGSYRMRVASVYASGDRGPFSSPSDVYIGAEDPTIPGMPGMPVKN